MLPPLVLFVITLLTTLRKKAFENILGIGENAGNQHFLLFQQSFLYFSKQISTFKLHLFCRLRFAKAFNLEECKFLSFSQELIHQQESMDMGRNFLLLG